MSVSSRTDYFDNDIPTKVVIFESFVNIFDAEILVKHCCEFGQHQILDKLLIILEDQPLLNILPEMYELAIRSECFETVQILHKYYDIEKELNQLCYFKDVASQYHNKKIRQLFDIDDDDIEESDLVVLSRRFGFHDKRIEDKLSRDFERHKENLNSEEIRKHVFDVSCLLSGSQGGIRLGHGNKRICNW